MRRLALRSCAVVAALLSMSAPARADVFEPIRLVSEDATEQADYAHDAVISGDGQYVAFDGSFGGMKGVWRRDLASGAVELVAPGDGVLPSISENGQYVSFTTTARLDEQNDTNAAPDVYVRNMDKPDSEACPPAWEESEESRERCAYTLASAVNGSPKGLSYKYPEGGFDETHYGALASGRSALSADGRYVAFVTTAESNLANPGRPESPAVEAPETPPLQVAVRDLDTARTELVSVRYDSATGRPEQSPFGQDQPVSASGGVGAVYPGILPFPSTWAGASISADGSTVAWMGERIEAQAPVLAEEPGQGPARDEPLWRRIGDPQTPTRRVTGGADPASPTCAASAETSLTEPLTLLDPCQGPFEETNTEGAGVLTLGTSVDFVPRLSADGEVVAFLANAREIASGEEFDHAEASDDLYMVNMADGLTRVQALSRLTEIAGGKVEAARAGRIVDLGVSPDGSEIAFSTQRTVFPLGSPAFVSTPAGAPGMVELFDIDLAQDTLTRVTQGFEGQPSEEPHSEAQAGVDPYTDQEGSFSPSFSHDGNTLAFTSTASDLVYGDGNGNGPEATFPFDGSDAFVAKRKLFTSTMTETYVSPAPAGPAIVPAWRLGATALSRRNGSVLLDVLAPGAGALRAEAVGSVRVTATVAGSARRGRRATGAGHAHARVRTTVVSRTVAAGGTQASAGGLIALTLKLAGRYSALAGEHGGLSAVVDLTFTAPGHPLLRQSVDVTFLRVPAPKPRSRVAKRRRAASKGHAR
jgi:hypothetical protein